MEEPRYCASSLVYVVNIRFLECKDRDFKLREEFNRYCSHDPSIFRESFRVGKVQSAISNQFSPNFLRGYITYSFKINYVADIFTTSFQNLAIGGWLL